MKIRLFLAGFAALSLAACSNDEVVSVHQQTSDPITFRSSVNNSRGGDVTTTKLTEFWVKAVDSSTKDLQWKHTDNNSGMLKFAQSSTGIYEAQNMGENDLKWPTGKTLEFYASNLDPSTISLFGPTTDEAVYNDFTPNATIADQIDFVYASNKGTRGDFDTSVPLRFKHALSQIIVKAKNSNSQYTIKVKGYKLVYLYGKGQFSYEWPVTIEKKQDNTYTTETPNGTWTKGLINNQYTSYASAFYGGRGYDDNTYTELYDNTNNYYQLSEKEVVIAGTTSEGGAMVIPQQMARLGSDNSALGNGFYIAVLVQIDDADGNPIYPALYNTDKTKRISYVGLPKYYGYVAAPISINWEAGKTYTYILDFSSGAGYVDPEKPDVADPNNPDQPGNNNDEDPHTPGDNVFGHMITFTQEVSGWEVGVGTNDYPVNKTLQ